MGDMTNQQGIFQGAQPVTEVALGLYSVICGTQACLTGSHIQQLHGLYKQIPTTSSRKVFSRSAPMQPVNPITNIKAPARMSSRAGSSGI